MARVSISSAPRIERCECWLAAVESEYKKMIYERKLEQGDFGHGYIFSPMTTVL
jgi:hypothetical protein